MEEIWKPVKDCPDYYISNHGRVLSTKHKKPRYLVFGITRNYLVVKLTKNNKVNKFYLARLVAQHFVPNPDNLPQVDHIDRNKYNNHWTNLRWVDSFGNAANRDYSFTTGVNCPKAKLTENQVREIRKRLAAGEKQKPIAKDYGTSTQAISAIKCRKSWGWLD